MSKTTRRIFLEYFITIILLFQYFLLFAKFKNFIVKQNNRFYEKCYRKIYIIINNVFLNFNVKTLFYFYTEFYENYLF